MGVWGWVKYGGGVSMRVGQFTFSEESQPRLQPPSVQGPSSPLYALSAMIFCLAFFFFDNVCWYMENNALNINPKVPGLPNPQSPSEESQSSPAFPATHTPEKMSFKCQQSPKHL